mmetsp:Transcript_22714/g.62705  ORF Transcript_22714/g.62705 Transcript_22714/m.62705 type:complete len:210 (+) Transcript_22714:83-712(+)
MTTAIAWGMMTMVKSGTGMMTWMMMTTTMTALERGEIRGAWSLSAQSTSIASWKAWIQRTLEDTTMNTWMTWIMMTWRPCVMRTCRATGRMRNSTRASTLMSLSLCMWIPTCCVPPTSPTLMGMAMRKLWWQCPTFSTESTMTTPCTCRTSTSWTSANTSAVELWPLTCAPAASNGRSTWTCPQTPPPTGHTRMHPPPLRTSTRMARWR